MKTSYKLTALIVFVLLALTGGSYGLWFLWDSGKLGSNPRAPVAEAMEGAVRKQVAINNITRSAFARCVPLELNRPNAEVQGIPGVALKALPGSFTVTLLSQTALRFQPARALQLRQMDYLSSQGVFSGADSTVFTENGLSPAKTYQLTWAGYVLHHPELGNGICLDYGQREFVRIENIEKLLEKVLDSDVYEVTYVHVVNNIPLWAANPAAGNLFGELPKLLKDSKGKAKVVRTKTGWRAASEVQMEAMVAAQGQGRRSYPTRYEGVDEGLPSMDLVKELVRQKMTDVSWASRNAVACLPINLPRGGDDRGKNAGKGQGNDFTVTYFDRDDRKNYDFRNMLRSLHILDALEGAGMAESKQLKPPPIPKGARRIQYPAQFNTGIRYWLKDQAVDALDLTSGRGCIPAGVIELEILSLRKHHGRVRFVARGHLQQTPPWTEKIAAHLPPLQVLLKYGLPMTGELVFGDMGEEGRWRIQGMSPQYPEIRSDNLPQTLVPLLPKTARMATEQTARQPVLAQQMTLSAQNNDPPRSNPPSEQKIIQETSSGTPMASSAQPPYPAGQSPVHVISIYEAALPGGEKRGFQQHAEGLVHLRVTQPDAVLLLFAYEPVEWHIKVAAGVKLKRVIATGYYEQRVSLEGGGRPQVVTSRRLDILKSTGLKLLNGFPTTHENNDLVDIATISRALTGAVPTSYQGQHKVVGKGLTIDAQTPRFVLPTQRSPSSYTGSGPAAFRGEAVSDNHMQRGMGGAYTEAWSDRIYSAGKVYYEGRMRVTGAMVAHSHANVGLCQVLGKGIESGMGEALAINQGTRKLYKDGDIFGIAADLDQQRLYYHVNGHWITGTPGSGNGRPLVAGKEYRACFFASGTGSIEVKDGAVRSDTTWEANTGQHPYFVEIPAGYASY